MDATRWILLFSVRIWSSSPIPLVLFSPGEMILPGHRIISQSILRGITSPHHQVQPCGVDLSLKNIFRWTSAGVIDFDNSFRKTAATEEILFKQGRLHVPQGAYLVQFNETVDTPKDVMGEIFVRSSVFRSGAVIHAGLMDAGYYGSVGKCR